MISWFCKQVRCLKSRCGQDSILSGDSGGESIILPFPTRGAACLPCPLSWEEEWLPIFLPPSSAPACGLLSSHPLTFAPLATSPSLTLWLPLEDPCDYIGPTSIIQANLPPEILNLITSAKARLPRKITYHRFQGLGHGHLEGPLPCLPQQAFEVGCNYYPR